MILPPFFGSSSSENLRDKSWYRMRHGYLNKDVLFFQIPSKNLLQSYLAIDTLLFDMPPVGAGTSLVSYVNFDTLLFTVPENKSFNSYLNIDALYYNPPPEVPEMPYNVYCVAGDADADLSWRKPYDNRSAIVDYEIQYSVSGVNGFDTWEHFDDPVSTGTGVYITDLTNYSNYQFRVAAINSIGTGEYGYSNIVNPSPGDSAYCKMMLYLPLDTNVLDQSCTSGTVTSVYETLNSLSITTSDYQYGGGSLFLSGESYSVQNGDYGLVDEYPHLEVGYNQNINWDFSGDFTIEMFIKPLTSTGYGTLLGIKSLYYVDNNNSIQLYRSNNSIKFTWSLNYYDWNIGEYFYDTKQITANNVNLSTTEYTHLAVIRYNNTIKMYINGVASGNSVSTSSSLNLNGFPIFIGANIGDYEYYGNRSADGFGGYIDQIIISKAARHKNNFTPSEYTIEKECNC